MKKSNVNGFTLIELLAVITIMGILMVVAIPAVSRTIENTRRDQFLDTAKQYANAVKTMWNSDSLECITNWKTPDDRKLASELSSGLYYVKINTGTVDMDNNIIDRGVGTYYPILLESGGKSSWGDKDLYGIVKIDLSNPKMKISIFLTDGEHGIKYVSTNAPDYLSLRRGDVAVKMTETSNHAKWSSVDYMKMNYCMEV